LKNHIIDKPKGYFNYNKNLEPHVWFEPCVVWEIKVADFSLSPVHTAAIGIISDNKGIGFRFPRIVRVREDKTPEQSTSPTQIAEMYKNQKN